MIDIKQILTDYNIKFVTAGPNTKTGEISINCPLCKDDPSYHLGINLQKGWWACWRSQNHRGKNIYRLLRLLGIEVKESFSPSNFRQLLDASIFNIHEEPKKEYVKTSILPADFQPIKDTIFDKYYKNYLVNRGFIEVDDVISQYKLHRCDSSSSRWTKRLIIPIEIGYEITWVGRSINNSMPRYLTPHANEAKNIKHTVFNYEELINSSGTNLIITEGSFDSLKIDYYMRPTTRSTCLFGLVPTIEQLDLIKKIAQNYNNLYIALDQGTIKEALSLQKHLMAYSPLILNLTRNKDFGEMSKNEIRNFLNGKIDS